MKTSSLKCLVLLLSWYYVAGDAPGNDTIPGAPQAGPIALVGGLIHPVHSAPVEDGTLLFEAGKIVAVGRHVSLPEGTRVVDVRGKHVYPGLFEAYSELGLTEVAAVRATRDAREVGDFNPNVKAHVSVNPDSEIIPVTRSGGVLLALSVPGGGLVSGKSAVLQLDGWTFEDLTLKAEVALHLRWPHPDTTSGADRRRRSGDKLRALREFFDDARAYEEALAVSAGDLAHDVRLESMVPVLLRDTPLIVRADAIRQIQSAVAFAAEQEVRLILLGGYDAPHCSDLLKKYDVPVIVSATHRLPRRRDDPQDAAYTLPERLRQRGVRFCISGGDRSRTWNARNLSHHAATAAAHGLPRDEALKAVTLYPARILGVDHRVGSLEAGKDATLIVTSGDVLETTTRVEAAYVQGREVDLSDRHKRLHGKYREKYRRSDSLLDRSRRSRRF